MSSFPLLIAITGPSASGKTTLAKRLQQQLGNTPNRLLCEDAYYHDHPHLDHQQRAQLNYDHPDAFDHELLLHHLTELKQGRSIKQPCYDYQQHRRAQHTDLCHPAAIIIVEGMLLLHREALRKLFHYRLFLDIPLQQCLQRRIDRDVNERGRKREQVVQQFATTVAPMYQQFITPTKQHADQVATANHSQEDLIQEILDWIRKKELAATQK